VEGGALKWTDLSAQHGYGGVGTVDVLWHRFDNATGRAEASGASPPDWSRGYWMAELSSCARPGQRIRVYVRGGAEPRLVGVEHEWQDRVR
jgi:hypothetical protein